MVTWADREKKKKPVHFMFQNSEILAAFRSNSVMWIWRKPMPTAWKFIGALVQISLEWLFYTVMNSMLEIWNLTKLFQIDCIVLELYHWQIHELNLASMLTMLLFFDYITGISIVFKYLIFFVSTLVLRKLIKNGKLWTTIFKYLFSSMRTMLFGWSRRGN